MNSPTKVFHRQVSYRSAAICQSKSGQSSARSGARRWHPPRTGSWRRATGWAPPSRIPASVAGAFASRARSWQLAWGAKRARYDAFPDSFMSRAHSPRDVWKCNRTVSRRPPHSTLANWLRRLQTHGNHQQLAPQPLQILQTQFGLSKIFMVMGVHVSAKKWIYASTHKKAHFIYSAVRTESSKNVHSIAHWIAISIHHLWEKLLRETLIETNIRKKFNFTHENWISVVVNKRFDCVVVWVKSSFKFDQWFQRVSKLLDSETGLLSAVQFFSPKCINFTLITIISNV